MVEPRRQPAEHRLQAGELVAHLLDRVSRAARRDDCRLDRLSVVCRHPSIGKRSDLDPAASRPWAHFWSRMISASAPSEPRTARSASLMSRPQKRLGFIAPPDDAEGLDLDAVGNFVMRQAPRPAACND